MLRHTTASGLEKAVADRKLAFWVRLSSYSTVTRRGLQSGERK